MRVKRLMPMLRVVNFSHLCLCYYTVKIRDSDPGGKTSEEEACGARQLLLQVRSSLQLIASDELT